MSFVIKEQLQAMLMAVSYGIASLGAQVTQGQHLTCMSPVSIQIDIPAYTHAKIANGPQQKRRTYAGQCCNGARDVVLEAIVDGYGSTVYERSLSRY